MSRAACRAMVKLGAVGVDVAVGGVERVGYRDA
jgi:hypothetical protein